MKITYELSVSELKALLELLAEVCKRSGLDETLSKDIIRKLNEKHFK